MAFTLNDTLSPPRDVVGYGRHAPIVTWPNEARIALSFVVGYEEGSEASHPAGDGRSERVGEFATLLSPNAGDDHRDLTMESIWEYGSRAGVWRLARVLDGAGVRATFFASAAALELNPEVADYLRESEHEICAHGWRWEDVSHLSEEEERSRIRRAVESISQTCGRRPVGWFNRAASINTRRLLVEHGGFLYDSNAYNDDLPYFVDVAGTRHLVVPYSFTYNDMRFVYPGYSDPGSFVAYLRRGLDFYWDEGATHPKMMSIGLHPKWVGQAGRASALAEFIDYARGKPGVWVARRADIAQWWLDHYEEFGR
jgi:peptidoglycan/xylan/chitin deacetylase (PgdA/CDA1 family)